MAGDPFPAKSSSTLASAGGGDPASWFHGAGIAAALGTDSGLQDRFLSARLSCLATPGGQQQQRAEISRAPAERQPRKRGLGREFALCQPQQCGESGWPRRSSSQSKALHMLHLQG